MNAMTPPITIHLQPGETLSQALTRAVALGLARIPPGTYTVDNSPAALQSPYEFGASLKEQTPKQRKP